MDKRILWIALGIVLIVMLGGAVILARLLIRPTGPAVETPVPPTMPVAAPATTVPAEPTSVVVCGRTTAMNVLVVLAGHTADGGSAEALAARLVQADFPDENGGVVAFPRDLLLPAAGGLASQQRLDEIFRTGRAASGGNLAVGANAVAQALRETFGVAIEHHVTIDLDQLASLIDDAGGVVVQIHAPYDARSIGLSYFQPGMTSMTGDVALAYATAVDTNSVWDGLARQTEVLVGLRNRILSAGMIPRLPELFERYRTLVVTDLGLDDLVALGCLLERVPADAIPFVVVGPEVTSFAADGALVPDTQAITRLIAETFGD